MQADRRSMLVAVALAAALNTACEKPVAVAPPPPEVYVATVVQQDVPVYLELVGQTAGLPGRRDPRARRRLPRDGELPRGLVRPQGRPALRDRSRSRSRRSLAPAAKADQATAQARLAKANNDVARYTPLVAKQAVSQQELDDARAAQDAARVARSRPRKAAVEKATLDLELHAHHVADQRARRHHAGEAGQPRRPRREHAADDDLADRSDPLPRRRHRGRLPAHRQARARRGPARRREASGIQLTLADGSVVPAHGHASDRSSARSTPRPAPSASSSRFPTPTRLLRPGQYGRARLLLDTKTGALLVPQRAVQELQNLYSVAVVDADNKVAFRNVKVGPRVDSLWVIEEGLKPGEQVVVEGLQRIQRRHDGRGQAGAGPRTQHRARPQPAAEAK